MIEALTHERRSFFLGHRTRCSTSVRVPGQQLPSPLFVPSHELSTAFGATGLHDFAGIEVACAFSVVRSQCAKFGSVPSRGSSVPPRAGPPFLAARLRKERRSESMKRSTLMLFFVLGLLGVAGLGMLNAQSDPYGGVSKNPSSTVSTNTVTGKILSKDASELTVETDTRGTMTFHFDSTSTLPSTLNVGDRVTISYT